MLSTINTPNPTLSYSLIIVQFGCIAWLAITSTPATIMSSALYITLLIVSVLVGLWAIATMRLSRLNILPDPIENTSLVTKGPYRWVRHPMYLAVLLFCLALTLSQTHLMAWTIMLILFLNLLVKLHYEEYLLSQKFNTYEHYQTQSKKLIPYLY